MDDKELQLHNVGKIATEIDKLTTEIAVTESNLAYLKNKREQIIKDFAKKFAQKDEPNANAQMGFDDTSEHEKNFPGDNEYTCEYCGLYNASKPRCNKCEQTN